MKYLLPFGVTLLGALWRIDARGVQRRVHSGRSEDASQSHVGFPRDWRRVNGVYREIVPGIFESRRRQELQRRAEPTSQTLFFPLQLLAAVAVTRHGVSDRIPYIEGGVPRLHGPSRTDADEDVRAARGGRPGVRSAMTRRAPKKDDRPRPLLSNTMLDQMVREALVDAYGESEQIVAFYTMLDQNLAVPFHAKMLGVEVVVERVDTTDDDQIVAVCASGRYRQCVHILDLPMPDAPPAGVEWIEAFRRWTRGR
jgi:hypothetical protein